MEALSRIAGLALDEVTDGAFHELPTLGIVGLLNDFQYAWLDRLNIPYKFEMLDLARLLCNGENKAVFKATQSGCIGDIRNKLSSYIVRNHKSDDRVILSLAFDGTRVNTEWVELDEYLQYTKAS